MKLVTIPKEKYDDYRLDVIFNAYKWDPQFYDNNTVSKHLLVITEEEAAEIERLTEKLTAETVAAENALLHNQKLAKPLALPRGLRGQIARMKNYNADEHIRLMRFDFHPVRGGGYAISEVNSDVPGGFAEASVLPEIAAKLLDGRRMRHKNFGGLLTSAIAAKTKESGRIAVVHCTSYSDDRQVMQLLGDMLIKKNRVPVYCASDHIVFEGGKATTILDGNQGRVDGIFRFTPLEWLIGTKRAWHGYFDTTTPSCNHPISIFAQTKRFPLVWNSLEALGVDLPTWRALLPHTTNVRDAKTEDGYIYKPACGRVGEGITIKAACRGDEYEKTMKDVARRPKSYIAQKMFDSLPLISDEGGSYHVCLGAYSVEGKAAGFYARISDSPRIDSYSADIPVLVEDGL